MEFNKLHQKIPVPTSEVTVNQQGIRQSLCWWTYTLLSLKLTSLIQVTFRRVFMKNNIIVN